MATPTQEQAKPPIKGSWEELLMRAQRMAANNNDEAVDIYNKLIDRLSALPPERRMVSNGRLQNILVQSCVNAQAYLNVHERYDEALRVMEQMSQVVEEDELPSLNLHRAEILLTAGRVEDAIAILRGIAQENDNDVDNLATIFQAYVREGLLDKAEGVLNEIEAAFEAQAPGATEGESAGETEGEAEGESALEERQQERAYIDTLHAELALERQQWQTAIDRYQQAVEGDPTYGETTHFMYMPLVRGGQYEAALPYIAQDKQRKVRSAFWEALARYHLGETKKAEELWTQVTETELDEEEARNFNEVVLSFYYLGDAERMGLELLLRLINEVRNPNWSIFFLTGLGWAMHGNLRNARINLDLALQQRRMTAQGTTFPTESAVFVRDLLNAEAQAELAEYFELGESEAAPAADDSPAEAEDSETTQEAGDA